jgi:hypothetical protein
MSRHYLSLAAGVVLLLIAHTASAGRGDLYYGVDVANWTYTEAPDTGSATGIRGIVGQQFSDTLGWEAHLVAGGNTWIAGIGNVQMNALGGAYMRLNVPFGTGDVHALVGVGSATFSSGPYWTYDTGLSYGFGVIGNISERVALRADYMQYVVSTFWDAKAITFGLNIYL